MTKLFFAFVLIAPNFSSAFVVQTTSRAKLPLPSPRLNINEPDIESRISFTASYAKSFLFASPESSGASSVVDDPNELESKSVATNTTVKIVSADSVTDKVPLIDPPPTKIRQLKDRMWVREALEDLTSSEFACSLSPSNLGDSPNEGRSKRAVDFEALLQKLDRRVEEMCVEGSDEDEKCFVLEIDGNNECFLLRNGEGMGSVVYTHEQREALLLRVMSTRERLIKAMSGATTTTTDDEPNLDQIRSQLQEKSLSSNESKKEQTEATDIFPKLYVRDDGSVDWDGALQDREALKLFGSSVWARINGKDPNSVDEENPPDEESEEAHGGNRVRAEIKETEEIIKMRGTLESLKTELDEMEIKHTILLNSAIPPTTPNPTVKMASISAQLRSEIKNSTLILEQKRDAVTFATLNYELERVFTYLEADLGNTFSKGYIPLQDRLAVAEFGLLESQISSLNEQEENDGITDSDVLQVVMEQMTDFKRRLGIDYYVNVNPTWDTEALKRWSVDLLDKSKEGLQFYFKGLKLLWNDVVFCAWLLNRAVSGYTLKPREVRTLRRTFSDVVTFIPFVIILLIPISPVGHVFVFGAIQRFYPDFFPSMFTERRQNLLQLYESTEYSEITIKETLREKFLRFSDAVMSSLLLKLKGSDDDVRKKNKEDK